ncbi:MAG: arylsulfatase [Planctomycetes bacterium]|nr:arylsulfatase [Planctomycetota bacterium]
MDRPRAFPRLTRRDFLRSASLGAAGALAAGCAAARKEEAAVNAAAPARKPNIIFILADDLGYGDLGCYGQKQIQTPHINRLAAEGVRFTQAYAGSTVCAPSRCCLMTGLHTGHAYVRGNTEVQPEGQLPLPAGTATVAGALRAAGYATGLIGKWGLGGPGSVGEPNRQGFDYAFGYLCQRMAHNYYPPYLWRNGEKVPLPNEVTKGVATKKVQYSHDLFADEALAFVEQSAGRPFFLYLALTIPHANNEAGRQGMEVPTAEPYADKPWPEAQRNHAAMITRMDRDVGRLMETLERLGLDQNTIVFFTSDNGPHREGGADPNFFDSSGPLRGIKRDLYEGGIRVPMLARWPGRIPAGSVSDYAWAFWDFLPTACDLAGAEPPGGIDGVSVVPALLGRAEAAHPYLYWEFHEGGFSQAVRMGGFKAVRRRGRATEIYDLAADLGETKDLVAARPDLVAKAEDLFRTARTESPQFPVRA